MLTIDIGPLALGVGHVLLLVSLLLATLVGWWLGRRHQVNPEKLIFRLLLAALLGARLAFVVRYFEHYQGAPWRVIDIRDGGFSAWGGLLAAGLLGAWYLWRQTAMRRALAGGMAAGLLVWGMGSLVLHSLEQGTRLPELTLRDVQGQPLELREKLGRPMVINLWATWCPPCRREMPVLAEAQRAHPGVTFVFANQGEGAGEVSAYLASQALQLDNVLLDSDGALGQLVGSRALPTTLFYDAEGRLLGSHLGELSRASLARALEAVKEEP